MSKAPYPGFSSALDASDVPEELREHVLKIRQGAEAAIDALLKPPDDTLVIEVALSLISTVFSRSESFKDHLATASLVIENVKECASLTGAVLVNKLLITDPTTMFDDLHSCLQKAPPKKKN